MRCLLSTASSLPSLSFSFLPYISARATLILGLPRARPRRLRGVFHLRRVRADVRRQRPRSPSASLFQVSPQHVMYSSTSFFYAPPFYIILVPFSFL
jgi:hypothetical protein